MIPVSSGLLFKDGKLLLVKNGKHNEKLLWVIPGGKAELGETPEDTLIREMDEETGLQIKHTNLHIKILKDFGNGRIFDVSYFICEYISGEIELRDPDEEIHEIAFFSLDELPFEEFRYADEIEMIREAFVKYGNN
jgi:8-oxo-dGTP diphosphatase